MPKNIIQILKKVQEPLIENLVFVQGYTLIEKLDILRKNGYLVKLDILGNRYHSGKCESE